MRFPQGLKPIIITWPTARVNSCPDTGKRQDAGLRDQSASARQARLQSEAAATGETANAKASCRAEGRGATFKP